MTTSIWAGISAMQLEDDGTISIVLVDGQCIRSSLGRTPFELTSAVASMIFLPQSYQLKLRTTRGHDIVVDLPQPTDLAPLRGRPAIYLDQNHWSTLTNTIHQPDRVQNEHERSAATQLIEFAKAREVLLPMSAAHMAETAKQVNHEQRYQRALTIAQLSGGWQLRDPLDLRRFELRQALTIRYRRRCLIPPAAITLEPNAVYLGRDSTLPSVGPDLPPPVQWVLHAIRCIGGTIDTLLDAEHVPTTPSSGWAVGLQQFATFLRNNPTGKEVKRKRTHARFIADLGLEFPEEAHRADVTPAEMSDWVLNHSEKDLPTMPTLGLFREVLHEKLSDGKLHWADNDLIDMTYLTAAAGYCDYVVGERSHAAHIGNAARRLGRANKIHRSIQSLMKQF
ncbi:hypothetical protein [Rhizohabitans arisaemae]|uniref:hypothetical protein n=1 Tax=Rhizohabitans arisaemae TaxID=2720610 RepID=UPI0024B1F281|nr:hypothetical protein [Rhizohabitans arisaemae]